MSNRLATWIAVVLAVVLLFAVNMFSNATFIGSRADLTEGKLYTLSQGTRNILAKLDEPVTMKLYLSRSVATRLPGFSSYADRVEELLREYERQSGGLIQVHVIEPEPFSEEEDRAVGYGLRGLPITEGEETLYFGLVVTGSTNEEDVIPFFSVAREQFLEYDVTRLISRIANPEKTTVGLVTPLHMDGLNPMLVTRGQSGESWMVVDQMRQVFEVRSLPEDPKTIDPDIDVLMLAHPKRLSDESLYAIDQFIMGGGHALIFVDPHADAEPVTSMGTVDLAPGARSSYLDRLLESYGVRLEKDEFVADISLAIQVRMQKEGRTVDFEYPAWVNVPPSMFDADDIVTGQLGNVTFGTPGSLVPVEGKGTTFTPLIHTSAEAATFGLDQLTPGADPQDILRKYKPSGRSYVLAARISGKAKSAFPDGPPPKKDEKEGSADKPAAGEEARAEHLAEGNINLIVVADADMLMDRFWVSVQDFLGSRVAVPNAANASLVINALDNLTGSEDLIRVRNRGTFTRPFDRVQALESEAELKFREKEKQLSKRLDETEKKLVELEERKQGEESVILTDAQQHELVQFRQERLAIRKDLREVRRQLHSDIESLEAWVKFANIGLVPILIGLGGLAAGLWRMHRRRKAAG